MPSKSKKPVKAKAKPVVKKAKLAKTMAKQKVAIKKAAPVRAAIKKSVSHAAKKVNSHKH